MYSILGTTYIGRERLAGFIVVREDGASLNLAGKMHYTAWNRYEDARAYADTLPRDWRPTVVPIREHYHHEEAK